MARGDGYSIIKRKRGGRELANFEVRIQVPAAWQAKVGRKERLVSLGTGDRRLAAIAAPDVVSRQLAEWRALVGDAPTASPAADPASVAVRVAFDGMLDAMESRRRTWPADDAGYAARLAEREGDLRRMTRRLQDGDLSQWEAVAARTIEARGLSIPEGSAEREAFVRRIAEASIDAVGVFVRSASGELDAAPRSAIVRDTKARDAAKANPGETIQELFEVYAASLLQAKKKQPAGVEQDRMVLAQFAEFVGRDTAVASIGFVEAKEFVDALASIPAGYKKKNSYKGLTLRQAIEKGKREGARSLSPITQQRYISTVSPFFTWLKSDRGGRRIGANPFDGLHIDTSNLKKKNARPPFTADQITAIINSPLFTGFQADGKEHLAGNERADDWRYWIPLVCLFTGARIGEVAQLHVDDVFRAEGIWCAEFRSDEQTGQRTKNDESRIVALHSTLLRIGLLAFVDRQRKRADRDGNRQLFPELSPGPRDQFGAEPSKWWRKYLARIGVKSQDARDGFGSHSFRHTLADQLRAAGHLDDVFGPLIHGHYKGGVTGGYGQARQGTPSLSQSMIESVSFVPIDRGRVVEGGKPVDFAHLFA